MDVIRPFMSQDYYNGDGNETQVEFSVEQSVSSLMQQSVYYLRDEITQLENIIILKTKELKELNLNCARQVANISDQTMDLEHLKIKIEHEKINRESRFEKVCDSRGNCKVLEKYFTTWVNAINQMMLSVDGLKELTKEIKIKKDHDKEIVIFHQQYSQHSVNQAKEAIMLLNLLGVQEEREFNKLQNRFKNEINKDKEKILEKQIQFQELEARSLQKNTMLKMLNSANVDLKSNFEVLNKEKESELDKIKPTLFKLESILNAEIIKGEQLNFGIGVFDSLSKEVNSCLGDLEIDVHNFNTKQKQLISKEDQYKEILKTLLNTTYGLSLEVEALKIKFSKCLIVNDHNIDLKKKLDDLLEINDNQTNNITNLVKTEQTFEEDLLSIDKTISNMVNMTHSIISKQLLVKHQNEQLLKKQKNDIYEHEKISLGFKEYFGRLSEEHNILDSEMIKLKESMYDASNVTNMQVNILEHLQTKYNKLHNIFEESEHKLNKQVECCGSVTKNVLENIICLNGMIFRAEEAYQQAQCNMHFNIYLKGQNDYLNSELLKQQYIYMKSIKETKETHAYKLESKTKEMEDSRKIHERLFRNKEQNKTDALVELKENRIKIADLKCQEDNLNYELKRMEKKLFKCENLLLSLENKLNVVAHVATEVSQSVADSASQNTIPVKPAKKVDLVDDWGFGC